MSDLFSTFRSPVLKAKFYPSPEKAILVQNINETTYILEYTGNGFHYQVEGDGRETSSIDLPMPGLWYFEGRLETTRDYYGDYDEYWVGKPRRLTPAELEEYEIHGRTPFDDEIAAFKLWNELETMYELLKEVSVHVDGTVITVSYEDMKRATSFMDLIAGRQSAGSIASYLRIESTCRKLKASKREEEIDE